jgi:hypothetical protein
MCCFIVFQFLLQYLTNAEYMISSCSVVLNPNWCSPVIPSAYGVNLDSSILHKNFVHSWQMWYAIIITTICFITLLIDRYNDRILPLLRQLLLIPYRNNKFEDLTVNCSTVGHDQYLVTLVSFSVANSTSKHSAQALVVMLCVFLFA